MLDIEISPNYYPNGFVNKFRNGTFDIAQRGTSGTITAGTPAYTLDGWIVSCAGANITWTQATNGAGNDLTYSSLSLTGATSVTDSSVKQRIEGRIAAPLASQTVTVQLVLYNTTGSSITPTLTVKHAGALDDWTSPVTDVNAVSLQSVANGAAATLCYTFSANSASGNGLEITWDFGSALNGISKSIAMTTADIRATPGLANGLNSNPPLAEMRPFPVELAFCQRYYQLVTGFLQAGALGIDGAGIIFAVPMRTTPTTTNIAAGTASGISSSNFTVMDQRSGFYQIYVTVAGGNINGRVDSLNAEL